MLAHWVTPLDLGTVPKNKDGTYEGVIGVIPKDKDPTLENSYELIKWKITVKDGKATLNAITLKETGNERGPRPGTNELQPGLITAQEMLRLIESSYLKKGIEAPFPLKKLEP